MGRRWKWRRLSQGKPRRRPGQSRGQSRKANGASSHSGGQNGGAESIHHRIMAAIARAPLGRSEIVQALGHNEYILPETPNSRLQKYRSRKR